MKKVILSVVTMVAMSSTSFAGGDFTPVVEPVIEVPILQADVSGLYLGLGVSSAFFDAVCDCGGKFEDYTYGGVLRVGYDFNQYIGVEARVLSSTLEENGAKIKSHYGIFLKPSYPVSQDINVYGLAGFASTEVGDDIVLEEDGFAWGVGLEYDLSSDSAGDMEYPREFNGQGDQEKGLGLFIDYEKLLQKDNMPDMHVVSFGLTYDF